MQEAYEKSKTTRMIILGIIYNICRGKINYRWGYEIFMSESFMQKYLMDPSV
jgi:hypothetical protein